MVSAISSSFLSFTRAAFQAKYAWTYGAPRPRIAQTIITMKWAFSRKAMVMATMSLESQQKKDNVTAVSYIVVLSIRDILTNHYVYTQLH